jgi:CRISPR system Cascade subunit CasE
VYLSRLILNGRSQLVRHDLADCQGLHRTLLRAFPPKTRDAAGARQDFGLLHRVEASERTGQILTYVQSRVVPDWSLLPEGYLAILPTGTDNPACKAIAPLYDRIGAGTVLAFALRANPTKKVGTTLKSERLAGAVKSNGRRVFLAKPEEQIEWLVRKGLAGGFELLSVEAQPKLADVDAVPVGRTWGGSRAPSRGDGPGDRSRQSELAFGAVFFRGRLRVTDRQLFLDTVAGGIGSGKAYGFGLLTVVPATGKR